MPACWTQGDLAARLAAEGGRNCTSNTLSLWRTGKRERMTESQRAAVILLLPKLEAEARVIRVSAMAEARRFAAGARDFRARQAAEAMEACRRQAARKAAWEATQLEERRRWEEANRLKLEREEAVRLERAERDRWQSVQSVDLELVAPHGLWAAGEDLLVDRRPLELRVRIRDHRGMCSSIHPASVSIFSIDYPCVHPMHPLLPASHSCSYVLAGAPARHKLPSVLTLELEDGTLLQHNDSFTAVVFGGRGNDEWGFPSEGWEVRLHHSVYQRWKHRKMRFVCSPRDLVVSRDRPGLVAKSSCFTPVASTDPLRRLVAEDEVSLAIAGEAAAAAATADAWIAATRARQQPLPPPLPPPPPRQFTGSQPSHWKDGFRSGRWIGKWLAGGAVDARLGTGAAAQGWRIHLGRPASLMTAERYVYAAPASWPLGGGFPVEGELFSKQQEAFNHRSLLVPGHATTALFREHPAAAAEQEAEQEADAPAEDLSALVAENLEAVATRDETLEGLFALLEDEDDAEDAAAATEGAGNVLSRKARSVRCGSCTDCVRGDCGGCRNCLDKPKFGGSNRSKQACLQRVCSNPQEKDGWPVGPMAQERAETAAKARAAEREAAQQAALVARTAEWVAAQQAAAGQQAAAVAAAAAGQQAAAAAPAATAIRLLQPFPAAAALLPAGSPSRQFSWKPLPLPASSAPPKAPAPASSLGVGHAADGSPRRQAIWSSTQPLLPSLTRPGPDSPAPAAPPSLGGTVASRQIEPHELQMHGHVAAQQSRDLLQDEIRAQPGGSWGRTPPLGTDATAANEAAAAKPMTAAEAVALAEAEGLVLIRSDDSQSGYLHVGVRVDSSASSRYSAKKISDGQSVFRGSYATAEEAALHVARHANEAAAAKPPPMTAVEAVALAEAEGLVLTRSNNNQSGFLNVGVSANPSARCRYSANGKDIFFGSFATAEEAALHVARTSNPWAAARLAAAATTARLASGSANTRLTARHEEGGACSEGGGGGVSASTHARGGDGAWGKGILATLPVTRPVTRPVALSMSKACSQTQLLWNQNSGHAATGVVWRRVGVRCSNRQPNLFTEEGRQQHTNKRTRVVRENRRHKSDAHCMCTAYAPHVHRMCSACVHCMSMYVHACALRVPCMRTAGTRARRRWRPRRLSCRTFAASSSASTEWPPAPRWLCGVI